MPGRRSTSRRSAAWVLALALVAALALAGCAGSGTQYVSNSADHTYFKVPSGWKLFGEKTIVDANHALSKDQRNQILDTSWRTAFDASPRPSLQHLANADAAFPTGYAIVDTLSAKDSDTMSDSAMRNMFFQVDTLYDAQQLKMLSYQSVDRGNGLHGVRLRARVKSDPSSKVYAEGPAFTFEQVTLVDQSRTKTYSLIVVCSSTCFEKQTDRIEGVVDSWTVKAS